MCWFQTNKQTTHYCTDKPKRFMRASILFFSSSLIPENMRLFDGVCFLFSLSFFSVVGAPNRLRRSNNF